MKYLKKYISKWDVLHNDFFHFWHFLYILMFIFDLSLK